MADNRFMGMSDAELDAMEEQIRQARDAANGKADIAAAVAFKLAYDHLRDRGIFGPAMVEINVKAFPKVNQIGKRAGFSETEVANIRDKVTAVLQKP